MQEHGAPHQLTPDAFQPLKPIGVVDPPTLQDVETFDCPFCNIRYCSSEELIHHVSSTHPQVEQPVYHAASEGSEICPTCSRRFPDVMSLIQHAETDHSGVSQVALASGGDKCRLS
jgi:uncharacterized Zn-finger protein